MCAVLLGVQCYSGNSPNLYWKIDIPKKSDDKTKLKSGTEQTENVDTKKIYEIIQVTDIHLDPLYLVGSEADCGEPLCCREVDSHVKSKSGYWGTYPCDLPKVTLSNALSEISKNADKIDLWYLTGDNVAHDIWQYTRNNAIKVSETIHNMFGKLTNKQIIPAIGNHEAVPSNWFVINFIS